MITGSHHQQVYWYRTGRGRVVGQIPGTYIVAERRWMPRAMVFFRPTDVSSPLGHGQLERHVYQLPRHTWQGKADLPIWAHGGFERRRVRHRM